MTNIEDYMKDKEFFKWNPFLKGYIYDEERKNQFSGVISIFTSFASMQIFQVHLLKFV